MNLQSIIKRKLLQIGFSPAMSKFIYYQAQHETGNFKSKIYKENHNLFGMKQPLFRETVSLGEKNGYAYYSSIENSIVDFKMWCLYVNQNKLPDFHGLDDYVIWLKSQGYFTDATKNYLNALLKFSKNAISE